MARDLFIHGISKTEFITQLQMNSGSWSIPSEDLNAFLVKFQKEIHISDLIALEDYLFQKKGIRIEEQHSVLGISTIISFRSKPICYAISLLINHYIEHKSIQINSQARWEPQNGSLVLRKSQVIALLDWLFLVSCLLNTDQGLIAPTDFDEELIRQAQHIVQVGMCQEEAFKFLGDHSYQFAHWKEMLQQTEFDHYYWEDSF